MPFTTQQEEAIKELLYGENLEDPADSIEGDVGKIMRIRDLLTILIELDEDLDTAIQSVDPSFDLPAMYSNIITNFKNEAKTAAESIVTRLS